MIRQFLESLEDREKPLLGPNYWILKKCGLILPDNFLLKYLFLVIHLFGILFIISQYIELYVIRSDIDLVISNMMISMLSAVSVLKGDTFVFWQKQWRELIDYVTEADQFERDNSDAAKANTIDKYTAYCRKVSYCYWVLAFATCLAVIGAPFMNVLSTSSQNEITQNRTEVFSHIMSSWMPLDKYSSPGCWITVVWHIFTCIYESTVAAAYDSTAITIMVYFECKLSLLRIRCTEMLGINGQRFSDQDAEITIRQLHDIHIKVIKYSRLFNSVFSPVMFFYLLNCSLMLCASGYQLTSSTNTAQKLLLGEYLVFGVSQLFVFCWHSNKVLIKNENLMYGPFESNWCSTSVKQRKYVLFLSGQLSIKHVFTAGPFTNLTLATFVTILKGAYSYYTLLRK
uniref:Odorant receptor n=1 Tax=Galleria mellonella TaxID=7137 RepID=A0A5C0E4C8_GALME|nr:odorant receptor 22 [Galleria mellonella]